MQLVGILENKKVHGNMKNHYKQIVYEPKPFQSAGLACTFFAFLYIIQFLQFFFNILLPFAL